MRKKLSKLKDDKNFMRLIFIIGIAGILLIFCSSYFEGDRDETDISYSIEDYQGEQEARIKEMAEDIQGVGRAEVMLTMENSAEQVYTDKTKIKEIEPLVRGVVVVCDGANNPTVKENLLEFLTKALNISADKVCITKLKEE